MQRPRPLPSIRVFSLRERFGKQAGKRATRFTREIQAFERVMREEPSHAEATDALVYDLLSAGYFEEGLAIAERFVELDPLSATAHVELARAQLSNGRTREAVASLEISGQLGMAAASLWLGEFYLLEEQDEIAIGYIEAFLRKQGRVPAEWVREFVVSARDPKTGQAYLDRTFPKLGIAEAGDYRDSSYLTFGFLDRFFEQDLRDWTFPSENGDLRRV